MEMDVITKEEKLRNIYNIPEKYKIDSEKETIELPIGYYYQLEQTRMSYLAHQEDEEERKVFADMTINIYANFVSFVRILACIFTVTCFASAGHISKTTTLIIGGISILAWAIVILSPNKTILYKMVKLMGKSKHQ